MANINKITEFKAGREALGDIHYTVYYDSGRRVNYYGRDTLPMTVVNFLTDENTVSKTVYIDDNYLHCVNSRTTYTPADKPQEAAPAEETTETAEQVEETETEDTTTETIEETAEEAKEVATMKKYFKVTFEYAEDIYCTNLAHAETAEDVEREYSKYPWRSIKEAQPWDVDEAKMKGMPIIEVEAAPAKDPEAVTLAPAEDAQVWDENGETVTPDTDTDTEEEEEEKPMFENLRNAVNAHYNQQAAKFAADLETITAAEALKTWYYTDRMTPAALEMVKAAATADQDATIPEVARAKIMKRYTNENEKNRARYLEKLNRAEAAEPLKDAAIVVDWTRSRTWGWNPTATVTVNGDYYKQTKDNASGCGYDKESAAICGAFNANPSIMRALYEHAEQGKKFPYSVNTYAGIPYFDGGCGVSCNYSVFEAMGYKFADVAHSRHGADVYSISRA